jgi:hypothetical protein
MPSLRRSRRMRIARDISDRDALSRELTNYRRTTNLSNGNMSFEPWRESEHDDLLFAVSLALWGWTQKKPQWGLRLVS